MLSFSAECQLSGRPRPQALPPFSLPDPNPSSLQLATGPEGAEESGCCWAERRDYTELPASPRACYRSSHAVDQTDVKTLPHHGCIQETIKPAVGIPLRNLEQ
jgi:hypothetical protein